MVNDGRLFPLAPESAPALVALIWPLTPLRTSSTTSSSQVSIMEEKPLSNIEMEDLPMEKNVHTETMATIKDETQHQFDHISEKRLLLKCDLHIVPILFLLFLCAFIDRINIGNARIQGESMLVTIQHANNSQDSRQTSICMAPITTSLSSCSSCCTSCSKCLATSSSRRCDLQSFSARSCWAGALSPSVKASRSLSQVLSFVVQSWAHSRLASFLVVSTSSRCFTSAMSCSGVLICSFRRRS